MDARTSGTSAALGTLAIAIATLALAEPAHAADSGSAAPGAKNPQVTFEAIPGTSVKRITLTARATERLGIATGTVGEQTVVRRQMVGGLVIPPMSTTGAPNGAAPSAPPAAAPPVGALMTAAGRGGRLPAVGFGAFAAGPAAPAAMTVAAAAPAQPPVYKPSASGAVWVLVNLSAAEWERTAKDKPVRLLQLGTRDPLKGELLAEPSGMAPIEDPKRSMLSIYYVVPGSEHGLVVNNRMRVELPMTGSDAAQKVVPYSAVYYDGKGAPWVYVNPKPLVYERQRVVVERIAGDLAVLSEGPPLGTPVVSVGAALLFGAELYGK
jgi:hypothetical protein